MLDPRDLSDERPRTPPEAALAPDKRALSWDETKDAEREVFGRSMVSVDIGRGNLKGEAQAAGLTYDEALQSRLATVRNRRQHRSAEHPDRAGHRREYDPRNTTRNKEQRIQAALADVGMYRNVSYRDLAESQFGGHPYTTRRAVDGMIRDGLVVEHHAKGPKGGKYKVLTLTEAGARKARQCAVKQGLDQGQQTWSGLVKKGELSHDTAVYRAAQVETRRLLEGGARIRRVRIDAELKKHVARATEQARAKEGKAAADAARLKAAQDLELPLKDGKVVYPDAQIEYQDSEGRSGRVNVEVASEHYSGKSIAAKAQAGFQMHGNGGRANAKISKTLGSIRRIAGGGDRSGDGSGAPARAGRDGTVEL